MAVKMFQGAPFGTQKTRFDVAGIHPQNKIPGTYTEVPYCSKATDELTSKLSPGSYNVDVGGFSVAAVIERATGPGWKRSYESAAIGKIPHLLYRDEWKRKKEIMRNFAPGMYNVNELDFVKALATKPSSSRGICATREERFRKKVANETPGPGYYGKGGIPSAILEEKELKSTSTIGMLSAGSSSRRALPIIGCDLAPGRYETKNFAEDILNKVVSKRGPYDLYSGERHKPRKTGHSVISPSSDLGPGQYDVSSFLDDWEDEHKKKHGRFGKVHKFPDRPTERIYCCTLSNCPRDASSPAPNSYSPNANVHKKKSSPPFLSSSERFDKRSRKYFNGNVNSVGVGRYDLSKWKRTQHKYGSAHVFRSTQSRFLSAKMDFFMKERVNSRHVNLTRNVFPDTSAAKPLSA